MLNFVWYMSWFNMVTRTAVSLMPADAFEWMTFSRQSSSWFWTWLNILTLCKDISQRTPRCFMVPSDCMVTIDGVQLFAWIFICVMVGRLSLPQQTANARNLEVLSSRKKIWQNAETMSATFCNPAAEPCTQTKSSTYAIGSDAWRLPSMSLM